MVVTVRMSDEELAEIKRITRLHDEAEAVTRAAREFLRVNQLKQLKAVSGKADFSLDWEGLEALELGEVNFPDGSQA
jgi:hypothetical protein